jgi:hypothetical protein
MGYNALHNGYGKMDNIVLRSATILQDEMWRNYIATLKKWRKSKMLRSRRTQEVVKLKNAKNCRKSRRSETKKCSKDETLNV